MVYITFAYYRDNWEQVKNKRGSEKFEFGSNDYKYTVFQKNMMSNFFAITLSTVIRC